MVAWDYHCLLWMCNVPCAKKLSANKILSLQESLFTIHKDGTTKEHKGISSSFLQLFESLHGYIEVKVFNPQGDDLELHNQTFDSWNYIIHNDYNFDLLFLFSHSYYSLSFFLIVHFLIHLCDMSSYPYQFVCFVQVVCHNGTIEVSYKFSTQTLFFWSRSNEY